MTQQDSRRVIASTQELNDLFIGSLIKDASGEEWFKVSKEQWCCIHGDIHNSDLVYFDATFPLVLIYEPDTERENHPEDDLLAEEGDYRTLGGLLWPYSEQQEK